MRYYIKGQEVSEQFAFNHLGRFAYQGEDDLRSFWARRNDEDARDMLYELTEIEIVA